jgi:hypothetical protein
MVVRTRWWIAASVLVVASACTRSPSPAPTSPGAPVPAGVPPPVDNPTRVQCSGLTRSQGAPASLQALAWVAVQDSLGAKWGLAWITPIVFDGTASTGTGLTYHWTMTDGMTSDSPTFSTTFPGGFLETKMAKLTVTDADGHQSSTTCTTAVTDLTLETGDWMQRPSPTGKVDNPLILRLHTTAGAPRTVSGGYRAGFPPGVPFSPGSGTITGEREFYFAAADGSFELFGEFHLHDSVAPDYSFIRVVVRGGPLDGQAIDLYAERGF